METSDKCPAHAMRRSNVNNTDCKGTKKPVGNYSDYLMLNSLLQSQVRRTDDPLAHDEHLFIVMHQNFELWFKQILYELQSIKQLLQNVRVCEKSQQLIFQRLVRINCILRIMVQQFEVLETMSSINFASFRGQFKQGQSGFQSTQFRTLEKLIGIKEEQRSCTFLKSYDLLLTEEQKEEINDYSDDEDICTLVCRWLSRTPALKFFITSYESAVGGEVGKLRHTAKVLKQADPTESRRLLEEAKGMENNYAIIFDSQKFEKASRQQGRKTKIPYLSFMGALMISCYASEPRFTVPYEIIKNLIDMDTFLTKWRFAHAMMAKRMIGGQPGTGGSAGYSYLRSTVSDRYMPFIDLFEVASYVIPPQDLPALTPIMMGEISRIYTDDHSVGKSNISTVHGKIVDA